MKKQSSLTTLLLVFLLAGCQPAGPTVPLAATASQTIPTATLVPPTDTPQPSPTPTQTVPTATLIPSTGTPQPSPTPTQTPTPILPGLIVFYSERDGDAEIYTMKPDGSDQRPLTDNTADDHSPSWSPDGGWIVFQSDRDDPHPRTCFPNCNYNLYLMDADGGNVRRLTDLPGAEWGAGWSPDGRSLVFTAGEIGFEAYGIYRIDLDGGAPQPLLVDGSNNTAPNWSPDGSQITFSSNRDGGVDIFVMDADGSNLRKLVDTGLDDYMPDWSPDGSRIAFFAADWPGIKQDIYTVDLDGSNLQNLTNTPNIVDEDPRWSPDGSRIVFQSDRDWNFEIYIMNADGSQPQNLTRHPGQDYWPDWFMPAETKIAFVSDHGGNPQIYLMPAPGGQVETPVASSDWQRLTSGTQENYFPTWSPDGTQIAYYTHFSWQSWAIMIINADGSDPRQLTPSSGQTICSFGPTWSPDGQRIAFTIEPNPSPTCEMKHTEIAVINIDGSGFAILTHNDAIDLVGSWTPDGSRIVFTSERDGNRQVYIMDADGGNPLCLTDLGSANSIPSVSPDGGSIAFVSDRDGNDEIYLMDIDGSNPRRLTWTTNADESYPSWSPDGRQIVFNSGSPRGGFDLYVINADGTNLRQLTDRPGAEFEPAWQPSVPNYGSSNTWIRAFESPDCGAFFDVILTDDGNILVAGATNHLHMPLYSGKALFMKLTPDGDVL
jgi:Tol biopolymer transport system component